MPSPRVQPWVPGRSASSFPEQRLVIEPRKLATTEFSVAFVVSEELVKNYRPFKTLMLSYYKNLRSQETAQKRHARASKSYGDYGASSDWRPAFRELIFEESLFTLEKKLKKEKLELITTHLKETTAKALRAMTVTGQRLLQEPEAVSDVDDDDEDDDDDEGDDTVLGETPSEESESEESECEEKENEEDESEDGDKSEFEPLPKWL